MNDPRKDIARKLTVRPDLFVVAVDQDDRLIGSVMAGDEGHCGWMSCLASARDARGTGVARAHVAHVEAALLELGCPKANLQVRATNSQAVGFYERLGYSIDETIGLGKRLIDD